MKIFICIAVVVFGLSAVIKWDTSQPTGALSSKNLDEINSLCAKNNGINSIHVRTENRVIVYVYCNDGARYLKKY